jgi:hypothetical protein
MLKRRWPIRLKYRHTSSATSQPIKIMVTGALSSPAASFRKR